MNLSILIGSMTGTATSVAQTLQMGCADLVDHIELLPMDALGPEVFGDGSSLRTLFLVCTSTFGAGDVPDNAQAFYAALDAEPRYLGHVVYGVVALGDQTYGDTFASGGRRFDARLQDLGARRAGDICVLDASSERAPEEEALQWCRAWLPEALSLAAAGQ